MGNLLSGIEGYTDLLLPSIQNADDRENAFRILEGVSRMNGILKDLRHYQEALELRTHIIDAAGILQKLMPLLADSEASRLRIDSTIRTGMHVKADERLVRQALLSVLRNAFEAGAGEQDAVTMRADCVDQGQTLRVRIQSIHPIQDEEVRRRLFEPFFTTKAANLGLGLTMARRIFQAHGGDITLSSSPEEMTTEFSCLLPRHA